MSESDAALAADAILSLCAPCAAAETIAPADVAKALAARLGEPESEWRSKLGAVRRAAVRLAEAGSIHIYRKGKPVDPSSFKGVYRLGPAPGEPSGSKNAAKD